MDLEANDATIRPRFEGQSSLLDRGRRLKPSQQLLSTIQDAAAFQPDRASLGCHWDVTGMSGNWMYPPGIKHGWKIPELNGKSLNINDKWSIFQPAMFDYRRVIGCRAIQSVVDLYPGDAGH